MNTSVIITVHNAETTIRATLESVFVSSLKACEVIVVDDASTDGVLSICKAFSVKVVSLKENRGPAIGRNVGVSQSEGEVLIFLDSDVTFAPDLLQRMLNRLAKDPELSGVGTFSSSSPLNPCFFKVFCPAGICDDGRAFWGEGGGNGSLHMHAMRLHKTMRI